MATSEELGALLPNVMRTMPYSAYIAVGVYAAALRSPLAAWLELGLLANEALNFALKRAFRCLLGSEALLLQRPPDAADSGIYPQHVPTKSSSSGMPSGHAQTSAFLAAVCSRAALRGEDGPDGASSVAIPLGALGRVSLNVGGLLSLTFVWMLAAAVCLSRTRYGGVLSVSVNGRRVAQHYVIQVVVGAKIGGLLGWSAAEWYEGRPWALHAGLSALVVLIAAASAAAVERWPAAWQGQDGDKDQDARSMPLSDSTSEGSTSDAEIELSWAGQ
ncbi:unnamed protein product [Polarella glacialis]|uniref:Dolichyldiphosphatase n=1 Tax=Polarella glacialis TaxID=89957 RepID=A0A813EWI0_POLGL|nr:unnamed protein product [Polarella glacialis]